MKSKAPQPLNPLVAALAITVVILPASLRAAEYIAYDASGNIVAHRLDSKTVGMAYDAGNRLVQSVDSGQPTEFSYDDSGAMVSELREGAEVAYDYRYGSRLSRRVENGESVEVFYDHRGYPVAKRSRGEVTPWLWEGSRMVAIGSEPQRPELANVDFLGTDLGRSGSLYGGADSGVYTGKYFDEDLQAFVFPYRFYRPDLLRWTTPDPIGYPDGWNAFAYVGDPVSEFDPYGTETWRGNKLIKVKLSDYSEELSSSVGYDLANEMIAKIEIWDITGIYEAALEVGDGTWEDKLRAMCKEAVKAGFDNLTGELGFDTRGTATATDEEGGSTVVLSGSDMDVTTGELNNNLNIGVNLPSGGGTLGATASGKVSLSVGSATFSGGQSSLTGIAKDSSADVMGAPEIAVSLTVTFGLVASSELALSGSAMMSDQTISISEN